MADPALPSSSPPAERRSSIANQSATLSSRHMHRQDSNNTTSLLPSTNLNRNFSGSRPSVYTVPENVRYQTLNMRLKRGDVDADSRQIDSRSAAVRILSKNDDGRSINTAAAAGDGRDHHEYDQELCCVFVGDYGIGKSTIIDTFVNGAKPAPYYRHRYKLQPPRNARIDMLFQYKIVSDKSRRYLLTLTEAPADTHHIDMERVRSLHYNKADVFLLCFSVVWRPSFNLLLSKLLPEIQAYAPTKPKLLVGLRADLRENKDVKKQLDDLKSSSDYAVITAAEAAGVVREYGLNGYFECSSITEVGLSDLFRRIIYVHNHVEISQTIQTSTSSGGGGGGGDAAVGRGEKVVKQWGKSSKPSRCILS